MKMNSCNFCMALFLLCLIITVFPVSAKESSHLHKEIMSLLSFKSGVTSDPGGVLETWKYGSGVPVCNWTGIRCNNGSDHIVQIVLAGKSLHGRISPALSNLSFLQVLDLSRNMFQGLILLRLGYLSQLKAVDLSWNNLEGNIPVEFGFIEIVYLGLQSNRLSGEIPDTLFCNGSIPYLDLSNNSLTGKISIRNECNITRLKFLQLWSNKLVGPIPPSLSNASDLRWLDLESNMLTGELPSEIVSSFPMLRYLHLSYNKFEAHSGINLEPFFASLVNSTNLQELELAGNNLRGTIPPLVGYLPKNLTQIHLDDNLLYGPIPPEISNLVNLTLLNLSNNHLNGSIPPELCLMGKLERVFLSNNSLSGEIPAALGDIPHLGLLDLSKNKLSGSIPDSFANLSQLRRLLLFENRLSGTIPPSLGKCITLEILDLSHNQLSGEIPSEVAALKSLKLYLNLSDNNLQGELPLELSKMDMALAIDLSLNNLSGTIPSQFGSCIALEYLNLSSNAFEDPLPASIGQLPYLKELDVSQNQLSGQIPHSFEASTSLKQLNFSFNKFSGNVSDKGVFSSLTVDSFLGNVGLCGAINGMPNCQIKQAHHWLMLTILLVSLFASAVSFTFVYCMLCKSKIKRTFAVLNRGDLEYNQKKESEELKYPRISHRQLIQATDGFSDSSLIGSGRFGHVYKGILQDGTKIAVKVLDSKAARETPVSFKRECQVLKRTRHRNLMRIITICSKPDFKALVFPLMSNGSLERHLYPTSRQSFTLDLVRLVSICSDVAEGLAYLHHFSPVRVVHCDLKPSNILLDDDFTALVTDFGISRLVQGTEDGNSEQDSVSYSSTDGLLCGSLGYIAPEYGMGRRASSQGDVYSFGVLLLEMITGRRPTDVVFHEGSSLHEWVKIQYPHKLEPIIEQAMLRCASNTMPSYSDSVWGDVILEIIELGLLCTQNNPSTRPSMLDVAHEIGKLKQYLTNPTSFLVEEITTSNKFNKLSQIC